ncbi:2-dehydropantoate 2-reductase [Aquicoccus sp. SCR17]|nr:2-dehydropantoate 2-reductase [Carideicomes alvinocaridis]
MRIAIIGCGAMGSVYAGLFAEAGHEVLAVSRDAGHVEAINRDGLRLTGASGDRAIPMRAAAAPEGEAADLVVIATKAAQAGAAARAALPLVGEDTLVLTIQNGLGAAEEVAEAVGPDRLAVGIAAAFGASLPAPGHAHHASLGAIHAGALAGLPRDALDRIVAAWDGAGFEARAAADIAAMQWEKLICNVAFSGPCAISGLTVGGVMAQEEITRVSRAAAVEAYEVARARGIALSVTDPVAHVEAFGRRVAAAKPSVLLDLEAGRRSEIGYINGAVVREAEKAGMRAPVNETITSLVVSRESGAWQTTMGRGDT